MAATLSARLVDSNGLNVEQFSGAIDTHLDVQISVADLDVGDYDLVLVIQSAGQLEQRSYPIRLSSTAVPPAGDPPTYPSGLSTYDSGVIVIGPRGGTYICKEKAWWQRAGVLLLTRFRTRPGNKHGASSRRTQ